MSGQPKTRLIPVIEALPLVEEWLAWKFSSFSYILQWCHRRNFVCDDGNLSLPLLKVVVTVTTTFSRWNLQENRIFLLPEAFCGLKYAENAIVAGLRPRPRWGSSRRSPDPLVGWGVNTLPIPHSSWRLDAPPSAPRSSCPPDTKSWRHHWSPPLFKVKLRQWVVLHSCLTPGATICLSTQLAVQFWLWQLCCHHPIPDSVMTSLIIPLLFIYDHNFHSHNVKYLLNTTVLRPLYRSACSSWHLQLRSGGFCWCNVLLPACRCWRQPVHSD